MSIDAAIALNRFGLGARPGELARLANPRAHLLDQLARPELALIQSPGLLPAHEAFQAYAINRVQRREQQEREAMMAPRSGDAAMSGAAMSAPTMPGARPTAVEAEARSLQQRAARTLGSEIEARVRHGIVTEAGFLERWTLFWSNHFTMAATGAQKVPFAGPYEREAIRPNVLGSFDNLLKASATHPGMLVYLDQATSIGPSSQAAQRAQRNGREMGLNENLAREILELHTVGSQGGYTQADVTEFARALTGWTLAGQRTRRFAGSAPDGSTIYVEPMHEPGTRTVMGRTYRQTGQAQSLAILSDLAAHPATAARVARKLAVHFCADDPPASLVSRLEQSFASSGGDLARVARTLVESPECWVPGTGKIKSPQDFLTSTLRATGWRGERLRNNELRGSFEQLGQPPFRAPSPAGWPDTSEAWGGPDAILKRADWSWLLAERLAAVTTARDFADNALGAALDARTATAISRAETQRQGITLALMSPAFQRR